MTFHFWLLQGVWAGAILVVFYGDYWHIGQTMREVALVEARAYLSKDEAIRRWAASHGGVYVSVSDKALPNPFPEKVPERDIRTMDGRLLTFINPAHMMREFMTDDDQKHHLRGHITSLTYHLRETAPDEWERKALVAFQNGIGEVHAFTHTDGPSRLRIMRPLIAEASCLNCHAAQGFKPGDIRGGISLALPMASYENYLRDEMVSHALSFGVLWLLGAAGFWWVASKWSLMMEKKEETHRCEKRQAVSELRASEKQLKYFAARLMQHQENERRTIALHIHEDIAQSLSAVKWSVEAVMGTDTRWTAAESREMQAVVEQINDIIDLIRRLTKRLSPVMLETLGIKPAIMVLCEEIMNYRPGSTIIPRIDIAQGSLPGELKIVVYRVLEDILKLAVRPGRGDRCTVALAVRGGRLKLVCGRMGPHMRALTTASERHPGLLAIQNRAESFDGVLMIKTGQKSGCAISVSWLLGDQTQSAHALKISPLDCRQHASQSP